MIYFTLILISLVASRDPRIGITSFGSVKVPEHPMEFDYPIEE